MKFAVAERGLAPPQREEARRYRLSVASFPWSAIADALALRQGLKRLFHGHQDRGLDRGQGAASCDRKDGAVIETLSGASKIA